MPDQGSTPRGISDERPSASLIDTARRTAIAKSGEPDASDGAWLRLVAAHTPRLVAYVRCVTREPAEISDLVADTWAAAAWCTRDAVPAMIYQEAWVMQHARTVCARWMAVHRREVDIALANRVHAPERMSGRHILAMDDEIQRAGAWIRELPPQQRYAVWFRLYLEFPFEDVAASMRCGLSTAKTHYWRGIDALRRRWAASPHSELDNM